MDDGKSHSQIEHGEFKEFRAAEMAGKSTADAAIVDTRFQSKLKLVSLARIEHKGEAESHDDYLDDLHTAFEVNDLEEIISAEEKDWIDYSIQEENKENVAVMSKVMIALLQASIKKGTVFTAYKDYKKDNKKDARGMYLAVRDAYQKTNSKLTRKDLKKQLSDMQWTAESKIDEFYHRYMAIVELLSKVKDVNGKMKPIDEEDRVERFQKYFTDYQQSNPDSEQSWRIAFDSADMMCAKTNTELTMKEVKAMIATRLDTGGVEATGSIRQQTGGRYQGGNGKNRKGPCWNCNGPHMLSDCPDEKKCTACGKNGHVAQYCKAEFNVFLEWLSNKKKEEKEGEKERAVAISTRPPLIAPSSTTTSPMNSGAGMMKCLTPVYAAGLVTQRMRRGLLVVESIK
jgi:hypothetical protein